MTGRGRQKARGRKAHRARGRAGRFVVESPARDERERACGVHGKADVAGHALRSFRQAVRTRLRPRTAITSSPRRNSEGNREEPFDCSAGSPGGRRPVGGATAPGGRRKPAARPETRLRARTACRPPRARARRRVATAMDGWQSCVSWRRGSGFECVHVSVVRRCRASGMPCRANFRVGEMQHRAAPLRPRDRQPRA